MSAESSAVAGSLHRTNPAVPAARRLYWSVRRELWENRSIYIAPVGVAALLLVGFLIGTARFRAGIRATALDPAQRHQLLTHPYHLASLLIMATTFIVAVFYCLDALHGERRDRSILFWKSLPVSDLMTVIAKASIPLVILPLLTFAITLATHGAMLVLSTVALAGSGVNAATLWTEVEPGRMWMVLLYHLIAVHALWYAPGYAWLLLVSAWARRAAFLWAVLPLAAVAAAERIAFGTSYFAAALGRHMGGPGAGALTGSGMSMTDMTSVAPAQFLATAGLWIGLAVAAAFLAGAVRLRRSRGPL
jgi:ABC-2 type transport system permease protein